MVDKMSKLAITLLPGTETRYECCQSLFPVLLVEWLLPVLLFALNHCCQSWKGIFILSGRTSPWHPFHLTRLVETLEARPCGVDAKIKQLFTEVKKLIQFSIYFP